MIPAANDLLNELGLSLPILSCHAHFLADVGEDLLEDSHGALRSLFRSHKVRPLLRDLAREIGRKIGCEIAPVREAVEAWTQQDGEHSLPEGNRIGLGAVRSLAQRVLDYADDSTGADFPFDRPYLDFYDRCVSIRRAVDAFLRTPPEDKEVRRALLRLARISDPVRCDLSFARVARTLRKRAELFDELRTALRLDPSDRGVKERTQEASKQEMSDIRAAVKRLGHSLEERRPARGPAQDTREAIDVILVHLDRYGDSLWGHAIPLPPEVGGGVRLVSRTNNALESFNRAMKQGERRRSGRKTLSADFEHLPAEAALARNLLCPDYVEILCGSLDQLDHAFAELDADKRRRTRAAEHSSHPPSHSAEPEIASASLPKEDRRLVRAEATGNRILAATRSRAPRVNAGRARRPQRSKLDHANRILTL